MKTIKIMVTKIDLFNDGNGWCANGCCVERRIIEAPDNLSDRAYSRRILSAVDAQGYKRDGWADPDWSWRLGRMGVFAIIYENE